MNQTPEDPAPSSAPAPSPFPPPPVPEPLPERLDLRTLLDALLRRPRELVARIAGGESPQGVAARFAAIAAGGMLVYGVILGCFARYEQWWAAPLKVIGGLAVAGLICFPSLAIFSMLAGSRASASQLATCLLAALALAGLLLVGFAPALWIFAESTNSLGFMGLLALASWLVACSFAVRFLWQAVRATGGAARGPLVVWAVVFLLVTLQMSTSLRPILGRSENFLTHEKKFFLAHWAETFGQSLDPEAGE